MADDGGYLGVWHSVDPLNLLAAVLVGNDIAFQHCDFAHRTVSEHSRNGPTQLHFLRIIQMHPWTTLALNRSGRLDGLPHLRLPLPHLRLPLPHLRLPLPHLRLPHQGPEVHLLLRLVANLPVESRPALRRGIDMAIGTVLSDELAAVDHLQGIPLEAVFEIDEFAFGPGESVAFAYLSEIETFLVGGFEGALGQSHFSADGVFDAVVLVDRVHVLPQHCVAEMGMGG